MSIYSVRAGRGHSTALQDLTEGYLQRLRGTWSGDARSFRTEAALLEQCGTDRRNGAALWVLDGRGKSLSSEDLARLVGRLRDSGTRRLIAVVGPADGWSVAGRTALGSGTMLSLGPLTLPHELARLLLAEQIYRATTILAGHPYHLGHE